MKVSTLFYGNSSILHNFHYKNKLRAFSSLWVWGILGLAAPNLTSKNGSQSNLPLSEHRGSSCWAISGKMLVLGVLNKSNHHICNFSKPSNSWLANQLQGPIKTRKPEKLRSAGHIFANQSTWMFLKIGVVKPPKSSILIGFSIIFTIHFGFFPPIFGNTHIYSSFSKHGETTPGAGSVDGSAGGWRSPAPRERASGPLPTVAFPFSFNRFTGWSFQPIWKILVKLDHFPK